MGRGQECKRRAGDARASTRQAGDNNRPDTALAGSLAVRPLSVRCLFATVALVLLVPALRAQPVVLEGRVVDADTDAPLPGATAQAPGGAGAVADGEGFFRLSLAQRPAVVVVRFVGYRADTLRLDGTAVGVGGRIRRTVRLAPEATPLGEVTVTDENPAVNILRRVLARKAALLRRYPAWAAEGYSRLTLERLPYGVSEGTVVRLEEALTNVFGRTPGGGREEVVARRRVPEGDPFRYAALDAVPDLFFDDEVVLDDVRYPTPTHPDALDLYDVRLGETTERDGLRFYDIAIAPRGRTGLQGRLRVVDSLYVIAEAELRPAVSGRRAFVTAFEATYRVVFSEAAEGVWLPERFEKEGRVDVGTTGVGLPTVRFRQVTLLDARRPGVSGPDGLWASGDRLYSPRGAYSGRGVYARFRDRLPLSPAEAEAERTLGRYALGDLLFKEGLLRTYVPLPVEGSDDPTR